MALLYRLVTVVLLALLLSACQRERPVRGFVLPEGNADHGLQVFIKYRCYNCHAIPDVELPKRAKEPAFVVTLGGEVQRVKDYGELLTAIVYPNHVISAEYRRALLKAQKNPDLTPMPYYGDRMTVSELIDLTEFLHRQYRRLLPTYHGPYPVVR